MAINYKVKKSDKESKDKSDSGLEDETQCSCQGKDQDKNLKGQNNNEKSKSEKSMNPNDKNVSEDEVSPDEKILHDEEDIPENELSKLKKEILQNEEELAEYKSQFQRLQADFENFKRNSEKHKEDLIKFANEQLILKILDSYEDLSRALENSENEKDLKEGLELIYSKLKGTLEKEGLEEIPAEGEKFDPFKHEALMAEASEDHENGYIIDELMKGYILKDRVIKYSKVRVCKK